MSVYVAFSDSEETTQVATCQTCLRPNPKNVKTHINVLPERVEVVRLCEGCRRKYINKSPKARAIMAVYAAFDDSEETSQIATTVGWGDFCRWVQSLPVGQFLDLRHLCQHGWDQDLERVREQLLSARLNHRPSDDVLSTVTNLLEMLADLDGKDRITIVS